MADKITYYALIDEFSSRAEPGGVLRRVEGDKGAVDEVFSRDLTWDASPLLHAAERGDTMFDFTEITEFEANEIVRRIRAESSRG
jgi:triphosphoribosyl-dephospho-CoA synthetase